MESDAERPTWAEVRRGRCESGEFEAIGSRDWLPSAASPALRRPVFLIFLVAPSPWSWPLCQDLRGDRAAACPWLSGLGWDHRVRGGRRPQL